MENSARRRGTAFGMAGSSVGSGSDVGGASDCDGCGQNDQIQ